MANMSETMAKIWESYQLFASTGAVRRKGFELCGMTFPTPNEVPDIGDSFATRGESDLEHQAKVAWLVSAFISADGVDAFELPIADMIVWSLITVGLCHDIGEVNIGDIPDDGNLMHDTKDAIELKVFDELASVYPQEWRDEASRDYRRFQQKTNGNGQALYVIDKLEAVLAQLFYEKHGCPGKITAKPVPTDSDKYYMAETGSESSADCWAAHFCAHIRDFPERIKEPALALLDVAVRDVRGEPFAWWNKDILPYEPTKK